MYKLYATKTTPILLDQDEDERNIFFTLTDYICEDPTNRFLIKNWENGCDNTRHIWSIQDYLDYKEYLDLKDKSCVDLKKDIVSMAKVKVKTLKKR